LVFASLLLMNLAVFLPYFPAVENKKLLNQTEKIGSSFGPNDLILVDRLASGDPYSMISGPLATIFQKQAVYFFNPDDLSKIDLAHFKNIYLIIPDSNINFYKSAPFFKKLNPVDDYVLENESLDILPFKRSLFFQYAKLPLFRKNYVYGKIYLLDK
jgi:hypothetical protein